jgi:4-hydroxybenzoate polyprenyltransferase
LSQVVSQPEPAQATLRPLCVDLDGTLVKSDTLVDSLLMLLRKRPMLALALPRKLLQGKAAFKAFVTESITLDVESLPYNRKLLHFLKEQHSLGRPLYLATGADVGLARRVAAHLGIFSGVLGSDGATNLTGNKKLDGLRTHLGSAAFDYVGNATPDLPLLAHATEAMVANPSLGLRGKLRTRGIKPVREFDEHRNPLVSLVRAMRPHQWAKNLLMFLPTLLAHNFTIPALLTALLAFVCFSLTASATYIVNDLLDLETDRHHHSKRTRPFASGELSPVLGALLSAVFLLIGFVGARRLPLVFYGWLAFYLVVTLVYSLYLKKIPLLDVLTLSGLYTLRLLAGSAASGVHISHWLGGFSIFLFFSLAIVKRFAELENLRFKGALPKNGRGYLVDDLEQLRSFGTASAFSAVVIFSIYISGNDVSKLYRHPTLLWIILPFLLLWLCRVWLLASRGKLHEDPVVFALTDVTSLVIGAAIACIVLLAL